MHSYWIRSVIGTWGREAGFELLMLLPGCQAGYLIYSMRHAALGVDSTPRCPDTRVRSRWASTWHNQIVGYDPTVAAVCEVVRATQAVGRAGNSRDQGTSSQGLLLRTPIGYLPAAAKR